VNKSFFLICTWATILLSLFCSGTLFATEDGGSDPVNLEADQLLFDKKSSLYRAEGSVHLRRGELTLLSDSATYSPETEEVSAKGAVRLETPEGVMEADEVGYNLTTGYGRMKTGRLHLKTKDFYIAGDEIESLGKESFRIFRGTFTTCEGEDAAWKFGARDLNITLGRYATAKHVLFYLKDIPVLYLPYLLFPVKTERESGFLIPRVGYSKKRGTEISLAYYQVLARNMDTTFYLDYLSDLGLGKGIEYRYILGNDNEGTTKFYHVSGLGEGHDSHAFDWRHLGTLPLEVRLSADVEYVSSLEYFEDFGEEAEEYNRDQAQSTLFLGRNWEKKNLTTLLKYTKDLDIDNDTTLQKLPEIDFSIITQRMGRTPLYWGLDSAITYFWRQKGLKGTRISARPFLSAVFRPAGLFGFSTEVGFTERLYETSSDGPGYEREGVYDVSTRITTSLHRDFAFDHRTTLRHTMEPEILYSYVPNDDQSHLPYFNVADRIQPENRITYALTNRLTTATDTPEGTGHHDLLYLRLSQSYDIRESPQDPLYFGVTDRPFSDVRTEMVLRPTRKSFIDLDTYTDLNSGPRFMTFNLSGGIDDEKGNALSAAYRYRRGDQEYLSGKMQLSALDPVFLEYQYRYDLQGSRTLENVLDLEYRSGCWSIFLTLRDRLDDREYLISFSLTGLGRIAKFGGGVGGS